MKLKFRIRPLVTSTVVMSVSPLVFSFWDSIEYWSEPLILLSGFFLRLTDYLPYDYNRDATNPLLHVAWMIALFGGSLVWLFVLSVPSVFKRCDRIWVYVLQGAYAFLNAWLGIWIIGGKHC